MRTILAGSLIIFSTLSFSQNIFKAGILGGQTASQIHGDKFGGYDKIGFNLGGFVSADLSNNFSTGFDIYFINKGSRKNPTRRGSYSWSIRLNYIEIPVFLRYSYKKLTGEIGVSYGRLVNQKFLASGLEYTPADVRYFNRNEYGGLFGAHYQLNPNLSLNVRYSQSIWKVRSFTHTYPRYYIFAWQAGSVNSAISLSLRYQFGRKKT
jgi:hypothetical protein